MKNYVLLSILYYLLLFNFQLYCSIIEKIFSNKEKCINNFSYKKKQIEKINTLNTELRKKKLDFNTYNVQKSILANKLNIQLQSINLLSSQCNMGNNQLKIYNKELYTEEKYSLREFFIIPGGLFLLGIGLCLYRDFRNPLHYSPFISGFLYGINEFWKQYALIKKNNRFDESNKKNITEYEAEINSLNQSNQELLELLNKLKVAEEIILKDEAEVLSIEDELKNKDLESKKLSENPFQFELYNYIMNYSIEYPQANLASICSELVTKYSDRKSIVYSAVDELMLEGEFCNEWQENKSECRRIFGIPEVKEFEYKKIDDLKDNKDRIFGYDLIIEDCAQKINSNLFKGGIKNQNIIFHGLPGNGKTELFKKICLEIKKESERESIFIFTLHPASFNTPHDVTSLENQLKKILRDSNNKVLLCIDEIDGIVPARQNEIIKDSDATVCSLLTFINTMNQKYLNQVVILGATNYLPKVDAAIYRDGRFNNTYFVGNPHIHTRMSIIKKCLLGEEKELKSEVYSKEVESISKLLCFMTIGHSAASVVKYCQCSREKSLNEIEQLFINSILQNKKTILSFGMKECSVASIQEQCNEYLKRLYSNEFHTIIKELEDKDNTIMSCEDILRSSENIKFKFNLDELGIKTSYQDESITALLKNAIGEFMNMSTLLKEESKLNREKDNTIIELVEGVKQSFKKNTEYLEKLCETFSQNFIENIKELIKSQITVANNLSKEALEEMQKNSAQLSTLHQAMQENFKINTESLGKLSETLSQNFIVKLEKLMENQIQVVNGLSKEFLDVIKSNSEGLSKDILHALINSFESNIKISEEISNTLIEKTNELVEAIFRELETKSAAYKNNCEEIKEELSRAIRGFDFKVSEEARASRNYYLQQVEDKINDFNKLAMHIEFLAKEKINK